MKNNYALLVLSFWVTTISYSWAQLEFDKFEKRNFITPSKFNTIKAPSQEADLTLDINLDSIITPVRSFVFGNNAANYMGNLTARKERLPNWVNAGHRLIRYPGGNISNRFFWDGDIPDNLKKSVNNQGKAITPVDGTKKWMMNPSEFPELLDKLNADGIVCVNSGYARYGGDTNEFDRIKTAAHYAAEWVRYYNSELGLGIKLWEIGNEDYGRWQMGHFIPDDSTSTKGKRRIINGSSYLETNGAIYAEICNIFADSMKAADPSIKIGAVCYKDPDGLYNDQWNELLLPNLSSNIDFLIVHEYFHPHTNKNDISEDEIYSKIINLGENINDIKDLVEANGYNRNHFPILLTEYNQRGGTREISRTNALFISMCLGEIIKHGYAGANMWNLENGYDGDNSDNGSPDDHGMTAKNDPCLNDGDMNPSGYAHYYYNRFFGDTLVHSFSTDSKVYAYASTFSSGELGLVLVNTNSEEKIVSLNLTDGFWGKRLYSYTITGDSDVDRTCYINNVGPEKSPDGCGNGASGPQNYQEILPNSFKIKDPKSTKFSMPAYSANFISLELKN